MGHFFCGAIFILEPLALHRWFRKRATVDSEVTFLWLHRMHKLLLILSLIAVDGTVAGSHGLSLGK